MGWHRMRLGAVAAAMLLLCASVTQAKQRVVLQAYAGTPPQDGLDYVSYMLRTLGDRAPLHERELARLAETRISNDPGHDPDGNAIRRSVDFGRSQFIEGEYDNAIRLLSGARARLLANSALLGSDQTLRKPLHQATLFLAHAYLRAHDRSKAVALLEDAIRSFPDQGLSPVEHGPELVQLYRYVRSSMRDEQRSTLTVASKPAGCMVFVNERYVGLSPARIEGLYPGGYRIYLQRPNEVGRIHLVKVGSSNQHIEVDFNFDRIFRTRPYVGLLYRSEPALQQNGQKHALVIGKQLGADEVLLLGIRRFQGRRNLHGAVISVATGETIRAGMIEIDPTTPTPAELKALGMFLTRGTPGVGVAISDLKQHRRNNRIGLWKWITLGAAVAALGAGIPLLALHGKGTCSDDANCPEVHDTLAHGLVFTIFGGLAAATSTVLFVLDATSRSQSPHSAALVVPQINPHGGGLAATVTF